MKTYELTYLISAEVKKEELRLLREKINSLIEKEGEIFSEFSPSFKKKLAYLVKKHTEAYLVSLDFQIEPPKIKELEKLLKSEKKLLSWLILKKKISKIKLPEKIPLKMPPKEKKVELEEIEKKLEEILGQ
jgi:small subunit ribosomal protein S6